MTSRHPKTLVSYRDRNRDELEGRRILLALRHYVHILLRRRELGDLLELIDQDSERAEVPNEAGRPEIGDPV